MPVERFVLWTMPYLACLFLAIGIPVRIAKWRRTPSPSAPLYPLPEGRSGRWRRVAWEVLTLKGPLHGNPPLWIGSWLFHVSLALVLIGHVRLATDFPGLWQALGLDRAGVDRMSDLLGGGMGGLLAASGAYLLGRKIVVRQVREITGPGDAAVTLLAVGVAVSGLLARFAGPGVDLAQARNYLAALASLRPTPIPATLSTWPVLLHLFLAQALLMCIPFGKLSHCLAAFESKALLYRE